MRTRFLDVDFDQLTMDQLLDELAEVSAHSPYSYLVTPNVDHMVKMERGSLGLERIVERARYCLCDSRILAQLAKLHGIKLNVLPGSDVTANVFARVLRAGDRIAIVGGGADMVQSLRQRFPNLEIVEHQPPMGLLDNQQALQEAADFVATAGARFAFLAVGFPQQELIAARVAMGKGAAGLALCVGASLEFLTRKQKRAPLFLRRLGLEWAFRLAREPRRLWRRYLVDGPRIFLLAWHWRKV